MHDIERIIRCAVAALTLICAFGAAAEEAGGTTKASETTAGAAGKPNIVLIVADDLGYAEIGVNGLKDIPTPNIDSIARNGVRFTNGYVSCPVCSPTRAGMLTGRYQQRFGHEFNPGPPETADVDFGLPLQEKTIADHLKGFGYSTAMFGKWHLGYSPNRHPMKRGFDEFYGFLGGAHSYLKFDDGRSMNAISRGTEPVKQKQGYTTDEFGREAVEFIRRQKDRPFFVYLPFNAVHGPMETTEKYLSRFPKIKDPLRRKYAGMMSALDDAIGGVLQVLRETDNEANTLIFFISDNGGPTKSNTSSNMPLRGFKGQVLEGGIRVPFVAQWKGHIPAGQTYDKPVISLDILPTALAAAGADLSTGTARLDGVDLLPFLTKRSDGDPHDALFWRFGSQAAVRKGDWKLVMQGSANSMLYNLAKDIGESTDLTGAQPDKAADLKAAYDEWHAQLAKPLWKPGERKAKKFDRFTDQLDDTTGTGQSTTQAGAGAGKKAKRAQRNADDAKAAGKTGKGKRRQNAQPHAE